MFLMLRTPRIRKYSFVFALTILGVFASERATRADDIAGSEKSTVTPEDFGEPAGLPTPSSMSVNEFEKVLYDFLNHRKYQELGWSVDKTVRDTGPFVNGKYYGTHPAVRIFYSPEIMEWLVGGRKAEIPDGAMIIKEQYEPPAARHAGKDNQQLWESLSSWTVMVKDSEGSHDGWFWSNPGKNQTVVNYYEYPFEEPYSGFGLYCVRCHGSTKSPGATNEYTFASLRNIKGFPGEPLLFRVDDSWLPAAIGNQSATEENSLADAEASQPSNRDEGDADKVLLASATARDSHPKCTESDFPTQCIPELNQAFLRTFPQVAQCDRVDLLHIPPVTYDHVPRKANSSTEHETLNQAFITSDQCMSCHAGLTEPFGPTMFITQTGSAAYGDPGIHISPYGEWRWTPMGLSGRDPVFFAQLESELALLKKLYPQEKAEQISNTLQETCLGCHGAMGKRQHDIDTGKFSDHSIEVADVYGNTLNPHAPDFQQSQYGALARDGVSCSVCHRMQPRPQPEGDTRSYLEYFLETSITGNFYLGKPGEIYGPYKDNEVAPYVMEHSVGYKPKHSDYIKSSQMCGTCHTVNLPIVDWDKEHHEDYNDLMEAEWNPELRDYHHHVEQATYLEWLNSQYENEINTNNANGKSCQDCHMSKGINDAESGINVDSIQTRIAVIQDQTYPDAENLATHEEIQVRRRDEYSRHNFRGLNVFMLEMFNQFDDVLGVRKHDYMTGSKTDLPHAKNDFVRQAREDTAKIKVDSNIDDSGLLTAIVDIESLAGHRFPSGVGFRRAFIELLVIDTSKTDGDIVWSSGQTNSVGVLVDQAGSPLPTEFFEMDSNGVQQYQPHHEVITDPSQVQIYETLLHNRSGQFSTSFIHGCTIVKDNRFLPKGWTAKGPGGGLKGHFLSATYPGPIAAKDSRYRDGSGSDSTIYKIQLPDRVAPEKLQVRATLYYQAIPPYFLKNIFELSPSGNATQRLHYICSNIKLDGTPIEDWKLEVVSAESTPSK